MATRSPSLQERARAGAAALRCQPSRQGILTTLFCVLVVGGCAREYIVRYDNPAQGGARRFKLDADVGGASVSPSVKIGRVTPEDCPHGIYEIVTRVPAARRKTTIEVQCATPPISGDDGGLGNDDEGDGALRQPTPADSRMGKVTHARK